MRLQHFIVNFVVVVFADAVAAVFVVAIVIIVDFSYYLCYFTISFGKVVRE